MSRTDDWDLYRAFHAVFRARSLSGAARLLGSTQPTVGRRIDALETAHGTTLFVRSRHGLAPTEAAQLLAPHAASMAAARAAIGRAISGAGAEEGGTVRVTASNVIGAEILPAVLAGFGADNPGIAVELALSNRNEDLGRREADIAVRMIRPTQASYVAQKLGTVSLGLFAHRDYARRHGLPKTVADLAGHTLIGPDDDALLGRLFRDHAPDMQRERLAFRTDSELAQHALLRAGAGIGGMQVPLAARDPALLPVLPDDFRPTMEMWLVMHGNLRLNRPVRRLYDHLAEALRGYLRAE
ncbi:LysR family transcriptional regulator [Oceanibacterium hippocampi]|uniref:HTH-type transcriptional activator CmpR n=1 Tax=Oceanibacterium hippocampi TaxID=745714 RepID=A0A1Y5R7E8_9PROT|nr:LysR family transcriptional regulator [Oceanibacterium hippocampi]SLN10872.1 HTH-type transcriptional activator CmpR [Oceanibacterium hippocampi]